MINKNNHYGLSTVNGNLRVWHVNDYSFNMNAVPIYLPHLSLAMFEVLYRIVYTTSSLN